MIHQINRVARSLAASVGLVAALWCISTPLPASAAEELKSYTNDKFGYVVQYPKDFIPQGEPDAHDGQTFLAKDKSAKMTVWGGFNLSEPWTKATAEAEASCLEGYSKKGYQITLKQQKPDSCVISGKDKNTIFYQRSIANKGRECTIVLQYPIKDKSTYDKLIPEIIKGCSLAKADK